MTTSDSGGLSAIAIEPQPVSLASVGVVVGATRQIAGGPLPDSPKSEEVDVTVNVDVSATPGRAPFVLDWFVPADDIHAELNGTITYNIVISPFFFLRWSRLQAHHAEASGV